MVELLVLAATGVLVGSWLVGGRVAVGVAVMAVSVGLGAVALLRDVPERDRADDVRRRAG
jgi:hypothetical protein